MKYNRIFIIIIFGILVAQDIAFVGNSITKSGYNVIIDEALPNYNTYNFGVTGITVANGDNNYRNTQEFQQVLELKPQHIIVLLGTNDIRFYKALFEVWGSLWVYEYKWLITQFKKNSKVLLCTIPYQLNSENTYIMIDRINNKIYKIANEFELEVVDINHALNTNADYFNEDGVHPNNTGIEIMANEVLEHLTTEYLSIDEDYWETVIDYEVQNKLGWFGCSKE
jgi:lysophospholipase L1-like esterase